MPSCFGAATALLTGLVAVALGSAAPAPRFGGCRVFPGSNAWNQDVSRAPLDPRSDAYIREIDSHRSHFLHAGFGGHGIYGIPVRSVPRSQPRVPIRFTAFADESDPGPYPIPLNARVEADTTDRHVIVVQRGACRLYELYAAHRSGRGWAADSGAVFDLRSNRLRPAGFTSADGAGLPIFPGLARYGEVRAGAIHHALRFTVAETQAGYVDPARHQVGTSHDPDLPPMGLRLRLRASFSLAGYHGQARVILRALKRYGMIVADQGSAWYVSGTSDRRWNDDDIHQLDRVPGAAFEVVRSGPIHRR